MKRLAAVAVMVAWFAMAAGAQRGGSHGGFSGSHSGFSAPSAGFSGHSAPGFHNGPAFHSAPSFNGGMQHPAPPRFAGTSRYSPGAMPYSVRGPRLAGSAYPPPRTPYVGSTHRMPYHSPNGSNHNGWNHDRWDHDRWDHDGHHHHGVFYSYYGWGAPLYPGWGWGYPYLLPSYLDYPDSYDSQPDSYAGASQPYPYENDGPYEAPQQDQYGPSPSGSYAPWPYGSESAPSQAELSSPPVPEPPVTVVFKDGRPPQQIHNYLLTASTLSVLDQRRQDIPVDQIDLAATSKVNRDTGVSFALPGGSR